RKPQPESVAIPRRCSQPRRRRPCRRRPDCATPAPAPGPAGRTVRGAPLRVGLPLRRVARDVAFSPRRHRVPPNYRFPPAPRWRPAGRAARAIALPGRGFPLSARQDNEWERFFAPAAARLWAGADVYRAGGAYMYPPFMALATLPFLGLSHAAG